MKKYITTNRVIALALAMIIVLATIVPRYAEALTQDYYEQSVSILLPGGQINTELKQLVHSEETMSVDTTDTVIEKILFSDKVPDSEENIVNLAENGSVLAWAETEPTESTETPEPTAESKTDPETETEGSAVEAENQETELETESGHPDETIRYTGTIYLYSDGKVSLNRDSSNLFKNMVNLQDVSGFASFDGSDLEYLDGAFDGTSILAYPSWYTQFSAPEVTEEQKPAEEADDSEIADMDRLDASRNAEDYIKKYADPEYVSVNKMEVVNGLEVKQTLIDDSKIQDTDNLDSIMFAEDSYDKMIAMFSAFTIVYDVDENSNYYVSFVDTMINDADSRCTDYCVALNNTNGMTIEGTYYDFESGIVYIPKDKFVDENGGYAIGSLQVQLLQRMPSREDLKSIITVNVIRNGQEYHSVIDANLFDDSISIAAADASSAANYSMDNMTVSINGLTTGNQKQANYQYDPATGLLSIGYLPAVVSNITVNMDDAQTSRIPNSIERVLATEHATPDAFITIQQSSKVKLPSTVHEGDLLNGSIYFHYVDEKFRSANTYVNSSVESLQTSLINMIAYGGGSLYDYNYWKNTANNTLDVNLAASRLYTSNGVAIDFSSVQEILSLKCAHVSSPAGKSGGLRWSYGTGKGRIFKIDYNAGYMIVGLVTPRTHTQTGFGLFKIQIERAVENGYLSVQKASTNTTISSGDGYYSLNNAHIGVYSDASCRNLVATLTTTQNGRSGQVTLKAGTYYVKETTAPNGFMLNGSVQTVTIPSGGSQVVTVWDNPYPSGYISLTKTDAVFGTRLTGAEFTLYKWSVSSVQYIKMGTLTPDGRGNYTSPRLHGDTDNPAGDFRVVETKIPDGYTGGYAKNFKLDGRNGQTVSETVENNLTPFSIKVIKTDSQIADRRLAGAEFIIYPFDKTSNEYNGTPVKMTWNETEQCYQALGIISVTKQNMGYFRIVETKVPDGYSGSFSKDIQITNTSNKIITLDASNEILAESGIVKIKKTSKTTGEVLKDAIFRVYEFDASKNTYKTTPTDTLVYNESSGYYESTTELKRYDRSEAMPYNNGKFKVVEEVPPAGYILDAWEAEFEITGNEEFDTVQEFTYNVTNRPNTYVIEKVSGDKITAVPNVEFSVRNTTTGELRSVTTNENGQAALSALKPGHWECQEISCPEGYVKDDTVYTFTVNAKTGLISGLVAGENKNDPDKTVKEQETVTNKIVNYPYKYLEIHKIDEETGLESEDSSGFPYGTTFSVYAYDNTIGGYKNTPIANAVYDKDQGRFVDSITGNLIYLLYDDTNNGRFKLVETASTPGYLYDPNETEIALDPNADANHEIQGISNLPNRVIIKKVNADGAKLEGVSFDLWKSGSPESVRTVYTDASGMAYMDRLSPGKWYYKEKNTVSGYALDEKTYSFEIDSENKIVEKSLQGKDYTISKDRQEATITQVNYKTTNLIIEKYDEETGRTYDRKSGFPIGTEFDIFEWSESLGDYLPTPSTHVINKENDIKMPGAGEDYDIAVIDTGVTDPDSVINEIDVIEDLTKNTSGHGQFVVDTIKKQNPDARILSIRVFDEYETGTPENICKAIDMAVEKGVKYINLSIASGKTDSTEAVNEHIKTAVEKGVTVVAAAGNYGCDTQYVIPGNCESAIVVGAVTEEKELNGRSCYGSTVDYYMNAISTSEAAAMVTGMLSAGKKPEDEGAFLPDEIELPGKSEETGTLAPGIDNTIFAAQASIYDWMLGNGYDGTVPSPTDLSTNRNWIVYNGADRYTLPTWTNHGQNASGMWQSTMAGANVVADNRNFYYRVIFTNEQMNLQSYRDLVYTDVFLDSTSEGLRLINGIPYCSYLTFDYNYNGAGSYRANETFFPNEYTQDTLNKSGGGPKIVPGRGGYTFTGWYDSRTYTGAASGNKIYDANLKLVYNGTQGLLMRGDRTLYAGWAGNKYTLTINPNGGTLVGENFGSSNGTSNNATVTMTYDSSNYWNLGTATKNGYTFTGFYAATNGSQVYQSNGQCNQSATSFWSGHTWKYMNNLTVNAGYTANNYTYNIIYKTADGTVLGTDTVTNAFDTTNTITAKTFDGYQTPNSQSVKWDSTEAKTITFTYSPEQYTVKVNPNGGIYNDRSDEHALDATTHHLTYTKDSLPGIGKPVRVGYTFLGWYDKAEDGEMVYDENGETTLTNTTYWDENGNWKVILTGDKTFTLYAHWKQNASRQVIRVRYELDGGGFSEWETVYDELVEVGKTVSWSRAADNDYKEASVSYEAPEYEKTTDVTIYLVAAIPDSAFVDEKTGEAPVLTQTPDNKGKFKIVEKKSTPGYLMDGSEAEVDVNDAQNGKIQVRFDNKPNHMTVIKKGESGNLLSEAVISVWKEGDVSSAQSYTTDANGEIHLNRLAPGTWYYQETKAPTGYLIDSTIYGFTVDENGYIKKSEKKLESDERTLTNYQNPIYKIIKTDNHYAPLAGIVFEITKPDGTIIQKVTDANGEIVLTGLTDGIYTYREAMESDSTGLIYNNSTEYTFEVNGASITNEDGTETTGRQIENNYNKLIIKKTDEETGAVLSGAVFQIYNNSGISMEVTTNETGTAEVEGLAAGTWHVKELSAPAGYVVSSEINDFTVNADGTIQLEGSAKTYLKYELSVTNKQNKFTLVKLNGSQDSTLSGASIHVWEDSYQSGAYDEVLITSEDGVIQVRKLRPGTYHYQEISSPDGYVADDTIHSFQVLEDGSIPENEVGLVNRENKLQIRKTDVNGNPVEGVTFQIEGVQTRTGDPYSEQVVTDSEGLIDIQILEEGSYQLKEIEVPDGYILNDQIIPFTVEDTGKLTSPYPGFTFEDYIGTFTIQNDRYPTGTIRIRKYDRDTLETITDAAEFKVQQWNGMTYEDINGNTIPYTITSKGNGEYLVSGLKTTDINGGRFKVVETKAPSGYLCDGEAEVKFEGINTVTELSAPIANSSNAYTIQKLDAENGKALADAVFDVWKENGSKKEYVTGADGTIKLTALAAGTWYYQETKAPEGYQLNHTVGSFTVTEDGKVNGAKQAAGTVEDKPVRPIYGSVELTKLDDNREILTEAEFEVYEYDEAAKDWKEDPYTELTYREDTKRYRTVKDLVTTEENGGKFLIRETKTKAGYIPSYEQMVVLDPKGDTRQTFTYTAINHKNRIHITKTNEGGQALSGVTFQLTRRIDQTLYSIDEIIELTKPITVTTDKNGQASLEGLTEGDYELIESETQAGYYADPLIHLIRVSKDGMITEIGYETEKGETLYDEGSLKWSGSLDMQIKNKENEVIIKKIYGKNSSVTLPGAVFDVWMEGSDNSKTSYVTDDNGEIHLIGLIPGKYYFQETQAPAGYQLVKTIRSFTITDDGGIITDDDPVARQTKTFTIPNYKPGSTPEGTITLEKIASDTGGPLTNAEFAVFSWDSEAESYEELRAGTLAYDPDLNVYLINKLPITEKNGGKYLIAEVRTPDGYAGDWEREIDFSEYVDSSYTVSFTGDDAVYNEPNSLTIDKRDSSTGSAVAGAKFEFWCEDLSDDAVIGTLSDGTEVKNHQILATGSDGTITINRLSHGDDSRTYSYKETEAPKGYVLDQTTHTVIVTSNGKINGKTNDTEILVNAKMIKSPYLATGGKGRRFLYGLGIGVCTALLIASIIYLILVGKKKRNEKDEENRETEGNADEAENTESKDNKNE